MKNCYHGPELITFAIPGLFTVRGSVYFLGLDPSIGAKEGLPSAELEPIKRGGETHQAGLVAVSDTLTCWSVCLDVYSHPKTRSSPRL